MRKYFLIALNTWNETVGYRWNFAMWRLRVVLQLLTVYYLWLVLLPPGATLFNYDQSTMLTYVMLTAVVSSIVFSSRSHSIGDEINRGDLSNFLLKPFNYFAYHFFRDVGDKAMNIAFSAVEITILILLLKPPLFIQTDGVLLGLFIFSVFCGVILFFFTNVILGMFGFWNPEVWAPRFIFNVLLTFFSGGLFPLDILPKPIFQVFEFLPFTYMMYFPIKMYLGQLSTNEIFQGLIVSLVWIVILYGLVQVIWNKGLKNYAAQGS